MRKSSSRCASGVLLLSLFPMQAWAYLHSLENVSLRSPDNHWHLRIDQETGSFSFSPPAVFTLSNMSTGQVHRRRQLPRSSNSCVYASVDNGGRVVVLTRCNNISVFSPARGQQESKSAPQADHLDIQEIKPQFKFQCESWKWTDLGYPYRLDVAGRSHFCLRLPRGRRVIVDCEAGALVEDRGAVAKVAAGCEKAFAIETIAKARGVAEQLAKLNLREYSAPSHDVKGWNEVKDLDVALHLAGQMQIREVIPTLRELERIPGFDTHVTCSHGLPMGTNMFVQTDPIRYKVQLTLRRLGARPAGLPARAISLQEIIVGDFQPYVPRQHQTPRAQRVDQVKLKMSLTDTLDTLGEPDCVSAPFHLFADLAWEYDIDDDKPYTLRILWLKNRILYISRLEPPRWETRDVRDWQKE